MTHLFNKNVNVQNNDVVVSTTNPFPVTAVSIYNNGGNLDTSTDGFGRARISQPETMFDSSYRYGDDTRNWDIALTGGGTCSHATNEGCMNMAVGTASGDKVVRETKRIFKYQPGKSLLTLCSVNFAAAKTNLRQRIGYFGTSNGIFFEQNGANYYIVKRSYKTGSAVDTAIAQANWNVDKLDGTGPSGIVVDFTKSQIFWCDIEWLGVGSVRAGFIIGGQSIVCHVFNHANETTSTYMTTGSLPVRAEIENLGITASSSTMKQICVSIMSEGGYHPVTASRAASTTLTGITLSDTAYRPLVSIRLKSTALDSMVIPTLASAYGLQSVAYIWRLSMGGTITGGSWVSAGTDSTVEYNVTGTAITGDDIMMEGLFGGNTIGAPLNLLLKDFNSGFQLRRLLDGSPVIFTISALATTNNDKSAGSLAWEEF